VYSQTLKQNLQEKTRCDLVAKYILEFQNKILKLIMKKYFFDFRIFLREKIFIVYFLIYINVAGEY